MASFHAASRRGGMIESITVAIIAVLAISVCFLVWIRKAPYEDNRSDFD